WINEASYGVIIVPPGTETLLESTVELLEAFVEAGGVIIAFAPVPTQIEAEANVRAAALFARPEVIVLADVRGLQYALETAFPRRVSMIDIHGQELDTLLYMERKAKDENDVVRTVFFVVNNDRNKGYHAQMTFEGVGRLEEWDLLTGEIQPVPVTVLGGAVRFEADFGPAGSRMYVLDTSAAPEMAAEGVSWAGTRRHNRFSNATYVGPVCDFRRTEPNALTLDMCRYRMKDGEWSEVMRVWEAQKEIRDALDMRNVYYNGLPQRYKWVDEPHPNDGTPVAFHFEFEVETVPETPVFVVVEGAEDFQFTLNGDAVSNEAVDWYLDRSFDKVALPPLQQGTNTLTLACDYENRMEVEVIYLLGDFGVDVNRVIVEEPETLHFGDWTFQGYFHYPGGMVYLSTLDYDASAGERLTLILGEYAAVDVAIHVNGEGVGHIPWQSENGFDLTPYLQAGENEIGVEVVSSPRNMMGPFHRKAGQEPWTDWSSFRRTGGGYTPDYVIWPWGLIGQIRIQRVET
ncbi:MAG: glycosyl hydrolase, partial [Anaerolineae bacterium]